MAVVDYTAQIAALRAAIASGVTTVSYEGKTASYRSLDEMIRTVSYLERAQDKANGVKRPVAGHAGFGRGYVVRGSGYGC